MDRWLGRLTVSRRIWFHFFASLAHFAALRESFLRGFEDDARAVGTNAVREPHHRLRRGWGAHGMMTIAQH